MNNRWVAIGVAVVAVVSMHLSVAQAKSRPAQAMTNLSDRRAEELAASARRAATGGRVIEAWDLYRRASQMSTGPESPFLPEALRLLDGLRIQVVSGDRQMASASVGPRAPIVLRVIVEHMDGRVTPAVGVPLVTRWSKGEGRVSAGERTDESGILSIEVEKFPIEHGTRLEVAVDTSLIRAMWTRSIDHAALCEESRSAVAERVCRVEFVESAPLEKRRIFVLIEETVFGEPARESVVADRLTTALVDHGLQVVGTVDIGKSNREKVRQSLQRGEWNALRSDLALACDMVIYGRVEVRRDYVNDGGGKWSVARGRVGIYGVYSPEILGSVDYSDIAVMRGDTWENGAEACLRECASRAREKLVPLAVRAASAPQADR